MAENVNFPLDQGSRSSAFQGLKETTPKADKPQQSEDKKKEVSNSDRARENQEARRDIAQAERRELQANRQESSQEAKSKSENTRRQEPAERRNEQSTSADSLNNRDRTNEIQNGNNIDSVRKATTRAVEDATSVKQENPSPSARDTAEAEKPTQGRGSFEEDLKSSPPSPEEIAGRSLEQRPPNDAKVQERLQDKRVEEARARVKNEPALRTPPQKIKPVEKPKEPLREAVDNNPLRGPRPSELKDESDASAVETERGQNVSNLI